MDTIRIAGTVDDSIVDGPGLRFTIFTQGCPHGCEGCHNPETHDPNGGKEVKISDLIREIRENPLLDGITLSGGDPFFQAKAAAEIARQVKETGMTVYTYTGYTFQQLLDGANDQNGWRELLEATDVLIDGRFVLAERTLELKWRGSRNQRIIDVAKSLESGQLVVIE